MPFFTIGMERVGVEETKSFAQEFVSDLEPRQDRATVIGLSGELGSGKTTFVQAVASELGVTEKVTSPTFVILKRYNLKPNTYNLLIHIDAYRLESGDDLKDLGFLELLEDPANLIVVEWPERVADILPKDTITIDFQFIDEHTRYIEIRARQDKE